MKSVNQTRNLVVALFTATSLLTTGSIAQVALPKKTIAAATDMPRFTYPAISNSLELSRADDAAFQPFLDRFASDVDSVLNGYDLQDKATLRRLLDDKEGIEFLRGDLNGAGATVERERPLQEKPAARAMFKLSNDPLMTAWRETGNLSGAAFQKSFTEAYASTLQSLDWSVIQEALKSIRAACGMDMSRQIEVILKHQDEDTRKTGTMSFSQAETLLSMRVWSKIFLPLAPQYCPVLTSFVQAHSMSKPDIWASRDVDLTNADDLAQVNIAIWDSGVDSQVYAKQMYVDPKPGKHGPHGLAFDSQGVPIVADLQPLTAEQEARYPNFLELRQGYSDLHEGLATPGAEMARQYFKNTPPEKAAETARIDTFLSQWSHGTHVAGIAIKGNPAARLVVIQFNDGLAYLPFAPTVDWANRFKADFQQVGEYLREHDVRVVNMSWSDSVSEFEEWLGKTSAEKDPAKRKQAAEQIYAIWKEAVQGAIERAPNTLFVCAAGNSDSDAVFNGDVPASLHLPNLVTVGAVDQAGDETTFTSYGTTVVLDANGSRVISYLPGGSRARLSGTSMASPNVANLAAKLIAIDPGLTPVKVIAIMEKTADTSADGRLHLINPKAALTEVTQNMKHVQ
jgi:subtilisin family serine protease